MLDSRGLIAAGAAAAAVTAPRITTVQLVSIVRALCFPARASLLLGVAAEAAYLILISSPPACLLSTIALLVNTVWVARA